MQSVGYILNDQSVKRFAVTLICEATICTLVAQQCVFKEVEWDIANNSSVLHADDPDEARIYFHPGRTSVCNTFFN